MLCCESKFSLRVVYYLCNPLTKHWVALPPAPQSHRKVCVGFICMPYYNKLHGEGQYGVALNVEYKFKVVRICKLEKSKCRLKLEIFSSGKWTERVYNYPLPSTGPPPITRPLPGSLKAVVCGGVLYLQWAIPDKLIAFDFNEIKDGFRSYLVDLPKYNPSIRTGSYLGQMVCPERLCFSYLSIRRAIDAPNMMVWELKEYKKGGKWRLVHLIYFYSTDRKFDWALKYIKFISCSDRGYVNRPPNLSPTILGFHPTDANIVYLFLQPRSGLVQHAAKNN